MFGLFVIAVLHHRNQLYAVESVTS